jgi:hypothetical protein
LDSSKCPQWELLKHYFWWATSITCWSPKPGHLHGEASKIISSRIPYWRVLGILKPPAFTVSASQQNQSAGRLALIL